MPFTNYDDPIEAKLALNATEAEMAEDKWLSEHPLTKMVTTLRDDMTNLEATVELKENGEPEDITAALNVLKEMAQMIEGLKDSLMQMQFTKEK